MLVKNWMTTNVITVSPDTSMMKASRLMKEKGIRRLPVVDENGSLLGIVSDRDIKEASPSKATSLEVHEMYYLLSELKIRDIMTKDPVCAGENDSVEGVALLMLEKRFGGMPVVDEQKHLKGIITDSDIFKLLVSITGIRIGGAQIAFELQNTPGQVGPILETLHKYNVGVVSILTSQEEEDSPRRIVYIRLRRTSKELQQKVLDELLSRFPVLHYENGING
ncbi:MAG: CBS and ACT domain-containing protein [Deltaproteobacteria bacterium]|jgi:acetoin utilization protein AcuB|nr:CBS and ACT domain-containing protein [Deltaproteobacteria bacterium]